MSLLGLKLFGSTVKSFRTNLGWGTQKTSLEINLVQDFQLGDYFLPVSVGTPVHINFYQLKFSGLLQRWDRLNDAGGNPVYRVIIEDPRDILDSAELILSNYSGTTFGVPNLLNVFGFAENFYGFGGARINESGMPWNLIRDCVLFIVNNGGGNFGGALSHKGFYYSLDLSQLPVPPDYYRIGGSNVNLLSAIQQVCEDGGCDFFIDMIPGTYTIRVRTVSRRNQPSLGTISSLISTTTANGQCIRSSVGLESRNEVTSSFLVGGQLNVIYEGLNPITYFGESPTGNPIVGIGNGYDLTANLNSMEIFDIINSSSYPCTALEMCCAMADQITWMAYIKKNRPALYNTLGMHSIYASADDNNINEAVLPQDGHDFSAVAANRASLANLEITDFLVQRVYNFVKKAGEEFLGKKFLVEIPFVFTKVEPETGRIIHSLEPADAGYSESALPPLNLPLAYVNQFLTQDNRFESYCFFSLPYEADMSRLNSPDFFISQLGIYCKCSVDEKIVFLDPLTPCVAVTLSNPIYRASMDATGAGVEIVSEALGHSSSGFTKMQTLRSAGNFFGRISPLPLMPTSFAIPLKSNIHCYGPWYAAGAQGKVLFKIDNGLTPWNYGGYAYMDLAGSAMVSEAVTFQQTAESGEIELVGPPILNIGDQLQSIGPNCTGMDIGYSESGVTTTYRFSTFTNKFGIFSKGNIERMKRLALAIQQHRRDLRQAFSRMLIPNSSRNQSIAFRGSFYSKDLPPHVQRASPHPYFVGVVVNDPEELGHFRTSVTTSNDSELLRSLNTNNQYYLKTAAMSLSGLIRPISTDYNNQLMSCYTKSLGMKEEGVSWSLDSEFLNPFSEGNDLEVYLRGNTFEDAHGYIKGSPGGDGSNVRVFALRGPLVVSGWGWSVDGYPVPTDGPENKNNVNISPGYLRESIKWKTGPVDLLWDKNRGVWTPHGAMLGKVVNGEIPAGGYGEVEVWDGSKATGQETRYVYNFFSKKVEEGTKVAAIWIPEATAWYLIAADCP